MAENVSYINNYLKIYMWKLAAYIAGFASLAIVTPRVTSSAALFGIFSFCMSLNIFFQYADLGFINAAQKYASEYYGRRDQDGEIRVTGFCCFIFILFIIPVSLFILWISFYPELMIKGISSSPEELKLASRLLLVLFLFSPILIAQRIIQIIFAVRLEDYYPQRINIIVSLIRIASVFYFFGNGRYLLFEYFLFFNLLTIGAILANVIIAKKRYNYSFLYLLKCCRFSKELYNKTSKLAYNSFFLSLSWIIFYELDLLYIGYFLGKNEVAYYAIGLTLLRFFRDAFGTFYYPFVIRFNHMVGRNENEALSNLYKTLLRIGAPITVIPSVAMIVLMRPLILSWVGPNYENSIFVSQVLATSFLLSFITYPAGALLTAREQLRKLYLNATVQPLIFMIGVLSTQHFLGVSSYAIFKSLAIQVNVLLFIIYSAKYLNISLVSFFNRYMKRLIPSVLFIIGFGYLVGKLIHAQKGLYSLVVVGICLSVSVLCAFTIYYFVDAEFKSFLKSILARLMKKDKQQIA
jgi:O-antigen/teichoic acid export membrane protein